MDNKKVILVEYYNKLYWLPADYEEQDVQPDAGVPEDLGVPTNADMNVVLDKVFDKLKSYALVNQGIPSQALLKNVVNLFFNELLQEKAQLKVIKK